MVRQVSQLIPALALLALSSAPGLAAPSPSAAAAASKPRAAQTQASRHDPASQTVWESQFWKDMDPRVYRSFTPLDKKIFQTLTLDQYSDLLGGAQPSQIRLSTGESLASLIAKTAAEPKELVFTALPPCRVIDTRLPGAGDRFASGETRSYVLRGPTTDYTSQGGNAAGCGIPGLSGATVQENTAKALAINIIVVAPTGPGDMRAWPSNQALPLASVINYTNINGFNIANGVIVPMCDEQSATPCSTGDISFHADVSGGFLVADVTGYFHEETSDITAVTAGPGLTGGGASGDVTLSIDTAFQLPQACADGQVPSWNAGSSLWQCASVGAGDITGVAAGPGLTGGGTSGDVSLALGPSYQLPQTCASGQVAVWNGGASQWQCGGSAGGGGFGFGKGDLYEKVQTAPITGHGTVTVTVACNDANDLPLEGTCRPVPPAGNVLVQGERTIDWTSTSSAAKFECSFRNGGDDDDDEHDDALARNHGGGDDDDETHDAQARIVCVNRP